MSAEGALGHLLVIKNWVEGFSQTIDALPLSILRLELGIFQNLNCFIDSRAHKIERLACLSETRKAKAQCKDENAYLYLPYLPVHQGYPFLSRATRKPRPISKPPPKAQSSRRLLPNQNLLLSSKVHDVHCQCDRSRLQWPS